MVENSLNPSTNIEILSNNLEIFDENKDLCSVALLMLAEILQKISTVYISKFINLLSALIIDKKNHPIILSMVLDGLVQVLGYPSYNSSKTIKNVEKILEHIKSVTDNEKEEEDEFPLRENFNHFNLEILNAYKFCKFLKTKDFKFKLISTSYERLFWRRNHLVLRGFFHHDQCLEFNQWNVVLKNLIEISKDEQELKSSLVMPFLYKLAQSMKPRVKVSILHNLTKLGASSEIFSTIKAISSGIIRSMAINLHLQLWKNEPRIYPFLFKFVTEKSNMDIEDQYLNIVRAYTIKEICDKKPHHGPDLVSLISEILNQSPDSEETDIPASFAIDATTSLCENHIIDIASTWKAIGLTTRYEKRPRVVKSLCKFFALVPKFKRNNAEYEMLMKDILIRLFHMIQWSDTHGIQCALEALKNWNYDQLTLDMIPDLYREGISLPEAPPGMEVSILDLEVPGDCYVQLLTKIDKTALRAAGELVGAFIAQEISDYRSGHYIVKEGQLEPNNYKNLPKQSVVKALTNFVFQQATTKKKEKIVNDSILIEALRVLSKKYSRPLPPLNWTFLHEMMHRDTEIKAQCMALAAKQSIISGTAKRLIENVLVNINDDPDDNEAALDVLVDLCNGISNDVLKMFFEKAVTQENINEKLKILLENEKSVTNRENLATIISIYIKQSKEINKSIIKLLPPSIMPMLSLNPHQRIEFRCEILKFTKFEKSVEWINELIIEENHREFLILSLIDLFIDTKQNFPMGKWLTDFIAMTHNRIIEKGNLDFLLDILIVGIICMSGNFELNGAQQIFNNRFEMLPQSIELLSHHENHVIGNVFECIFFIIENKSEDNYNDAFKRALVAGKNHSHFTKKNSWLKLLQTFMSK